MRPRQLQDWAGLAAELGTEDGTDPKEFHEKPWNQPKKPSRDAQRLCGQVADELRLTLQGMADEVLQNLTVISVEPAPHTGRLMVTVARAQADVIDRTVALERLTQARGYLRCAVAAAIHRRKAPELVWQVL